MKRLHLFLFFSRICSTFLYFSFLFTHLQHTKLLVVWMDESVQSTDGVENARLGCQQVRSPPA